MKNNTNLIIIAVVALLLLGGGLYVMSMNKGANTPDAGVMEQRSDDAMVEETSGDAMMEETSDDKMMEGSSGAMMEDKDVKTFTVEGNNFSYDTKEINVKKGDSVKIIFKNAEGTHDWNVDEFNAKTNIIKAGEEGTVTFVADKAGTFEYYCSVGKHREMGMVGNLIVQE